MTLVDEMTQAELPPAAPGDACAGYVQVHVYPGIDTVIECDFDEVGNPQVGVRANAVEFQIGTEANVLAGAMELNFAKDFAKAAAWYFDQVRAIVESNCAGFPRNSPDANALEL